MTLRKGHGNGAGAPRIEVMPPDELPGPIAAPVAAPCVPLAFRANGTIADKATAQALQTKSRAVIRNRARLVSVLGLDELAADAAFRPYRDAGDAFVQEHLVVLTGLAGGEVGPGPSSIVASAGVQLAASRFVSDQAAATGDVKLFQQASALANDSRQNLLAAYELAVREGQARRSAEGASANPFMVPATTPTPTTRTKGSR